MFDSDAAVQLKRIADALEYFVECDRRTAEAEILRRTTPPKPAVIGLMDFDAAQARYDHERVEDGFYVERERSDGR
jgi:hypothetical protein